MEAKHTKVYQTEEDVVPGPPSLNPGCIKSHNNPPHLSLPRRSQPTMYVPMALTRIIILVLGCRGGGWAIVREDGAEKKMLSTGSLFRTLARYILIIPELTLFCVLTCKGTLGLWNRTEGKGRAYEYW